jgi:hypothetical protein
LGVGNSGVANNSTRTWGQIIAAGSIAYWNTTAIDSGGTTLSDSNEAATPIDGGAHVVMWIGDGATESRYVDGIWADPNAAVRTLGSSSPNRGALFSRPNSVPDKFYSGKIGELLVYNRALSQTEFLAVTAWLAERARLVETPIRKPTPNPHVVDVIIVMGQSNAVGAADRPPIIPPGFFMWQHIVGVSSTGFAPLGPYDGVNAHGIELRLATLLAGVGLTPFIFKVAKGATSLQDEWLPPSTSGWNAFVADWATVQPLIAAQYPGRAIRPHFIWDQGEFETNLPLDDPEALSYQTHLEQFIDGVRAQSGLSNVDFHIAMVHDIPAANNLLTVQAAELAVTSTRSNVYAHPTDSYPTFGTPKLHYTAQGFNMIHGMAYDFANAIVDLLP